MEILYLLVPLAILIAAGFLFAFIWAVQDGQFDDLETPPFRQLKEDESE